MMQPRKHQLEITHPTIRNARTIYTLRPWFMSK